ncbi:MAG TPA: CoA pyrophosphatase [Bauldia sp.]|nr:CoA pyrophosphatase [Bauldia sp.]
MDDARYSPEGFARLARERLHHDSARAGAALAALPGDHVLNPGFVRGDAPYRDAAVLVPVVARDPAATLLLTLRTPHLASHAGQIAFPGGKIDPSDASPTDAALREAEEEIGLDRAFVTPVGTLDPYLTGSGYRIVPVVAMVDPAHRLTLNPDEVVNAFEVPLSFLMTPENHRRGSREFRGATRYFYEMPFGEHYIWGVTAGIIRGLYERVFG